jgi:hypothetical protein
MFALTLGNGAAVAAAICQHHDARAHAAALQSPDEAVAAAAMNEDRAASSAESEGMLADGGGASLLGFLVPAQPALSLRAIERVSLPATPTPGLASLSPPPLLRPPLV